MPNFVTVVIQENNQVSAQIFVLWFKPVPLNSVSFLKPQSSGNHPLGNSTVCLRTHLHWLNKLWKTTTIRRKNETTKLFLLVLSELNVLPADLNALALAFLLPSARVLAFSIGWVMEIARFAEVMSIYLNNYIFITQSATTITVNSVSYPLSRWQKPPERACHRPTWPSSRRDCRQTRQRILKWVELMDVLT